MRCNGDHSLVKGQQISIDVESGGTTEAIVNLPPGTYNFVCDVPGHKQIGMNDLLVVKEQVFSMRHTGPELDSRHESQA